MKSPVNPRETSGSSDTLRRIKGGAMAPPRRKPRAARPGGRRRPDAARNQTTANSRGSPTHERAANFGPTVAAPRPPACPAPAAADAHAGTAALDQPGRLRRSPVRRARLGRRPSASPRTRPGGDSSPRSRRACFRADGLHRPLLLADRPLSSRGSRPAAVRVPGRRPRAGMAGGRPRRADRRRRGRRVGRGCLRRAAFRATRPERRERARAGRDPRATLPGRSVVVGPRLRSRARSRLARARRPASDAPERRCALSGLDEAGRGARRARPRAR